MPRLRRPRPPFDPALPALRRRTAHLLAALPPRSRALVRLMPLLLCTRFRRPALETEPPGLLLAPRRRRWGRLCEQLDLPPPTTWFPLRPLVQSVVLAPTNDGAFELLIVPVDGLRPPELTRVSVRVEAIAQLAARHAPALEVRMAGPGELTPSLFAWAAVVAGTLPALAAEEPFDWFDAFARAPSPLLRCLTVLVQRDAPSPLQVLRAGQVPSRPTAFLARWSGDPVARDVVALIDQPLSPAELDGLSRRLRDACRLALRGFPVRERRAVRAMLRPALFGSRVPPVLRHQLERLLRTRHLREVQLEHGWRLELEGLVLAHAPTLDQLRASALVESRRLGHDGAVWQRLGQLLDQPRPRALVLIEPGFLRHLVALIPKSGRPRVRRVDATGLLQFVLTWHRAGVPVELMPAPGGDPALVARASQLLRLSLRPDEPVGFQLGPRVLLLGAGAARTLPLEKALRRPRTLTWLPEQAEVTRALRRPLSSGLRTVQVVAFPDGDEHAALFSLDAGGALFRERVPRDELELTLHEYREVLRHADPPTLVSATVHPLLTSLAGRRAEAGEPLFLDLELGARGEQAIFETERFGSGAPLPWSALAEAVLSHWPPGTWAHVGVNRVAAPADTAALSLLACRARVLRRLEIHLRRISRHLRAA